MRGAGLTGGLADLRMEELERGAPPPGGLEAKSEEVRYVFRRPSFAVKR